jgi:outer membrane protein TolC
VADAKHAVELVLEQYEGGISDFNRVYTTQSQLVSQQDQLASARGNIALYLVQAYKALGGGWESFREEHGVTHADTHHHSSKGSHPHHGPTSVP